MNDVQLHCLNSRLVLDILNDRDTGYIGTAKVHLKGFNKYEKIHNWLSENAQNKLSNRRDIKTLCLSQANKWEIIVLEGCPFCEKALELMAEKGWIYKKITANRFNKQAVVEPVKHLIGDHQTFPLIFYNDEFIGGYQELLKVRVE